MSAAVLVPGARMTRRSRFVVLLCSLALVMAGAMTLGTAAARAGQWIQVSCENPDGSSSNAQGWANSAAGIGLGASFSGSTCGANAPLAAELEGNQPGGGDQEIETYTPPAGSTLAGGTISAIMGGQGSSGIAYVFSPSTSDPAVTFCSSSIAGWCATDPGEVTTTLPSDAGGDIVAKADCDVSQQCAAASDGIVAEIEIQTADLLLDNSAAPALSGNPSGTALGTVSGTGQLLFTATDSGGPGVYNVTVAIDGTAVYSGTPNTNNGSCVAVGNHSGVLMFDGTQPCPATEAVDIPVPTAGIANGTHMLTATVTDAADNSATVIAQTVTVDNPVTTPAAPVTPTAAPLQKIRDKAVFGWDFRHPVTRLKTVHLARKAKLPAGARISVSCAPARDCPKTVRPRSVGAKHIQELFKGLEGKRFREGAVFQLMIAAPHRKAERFVWTVRRQRVPVGHVRSGVRPKASSAPPATTKKKTAKRKATKKKNAKHRAKHHTTKQKKGSGA